MKRMFVIGLAASMICLSGCKDQEKMVRFDNVARIYMHERGHYSLMIESPSNSFELIKLDSLNGSPGGFFADVPPDKPMWVNAKFVKVWGGLEGYQNMEFHIHSPESINGAGWDHGKFGKGQTVVISPER